MQISPFDLADLNRLLKEGLDLPAEGREAWLQGLPDSDARLRPTLQRMLERAAAPETTDFLETIPRLDRGGRADAEVAGGDVIGPYRLLQPIGAGGMGAVWLAERADGSLRRQVALKLPLRGMHVPTLQLLARERDILAALEHPNIARLYDAGVDPGGQPYLALEYVDGKPIDAYCKAHQLDARAVLRLFLQVARAVAFAHANLVLHRDLKPSNILVTHDGDVRLLDFGIAKLLEGEASTGAPTQIGRALTPDYASPEQIAGRPMAVTSDVYALGVVLYELLAGQRPYRLKRESRGALEDAILTVEPQPPSAVLSDHARRRQIAGDLDTIVLKALKKVPAERYPTVPALVDDLERFLDGRPVLARPDRFLYRARKFALRNRIAVGAAVVVALAVGTGVAGTTWEAVEARRERDHALFEADRALAKSNMFNLLLGALGREGRPLTQRDVLDRSVALVEKQFRDDPRIAIDLLLPIAGQYMTLGDTQKELEVEQRAGALANGSGNPELIALVACNTVETYFSLNQVDAAREQMRTGEQALAQVSRPPLGLLIDCLNANSHMALLEGDLDRASALAAEGVRRSEQAGQTRGNRYTAQLSRLVALERRRGDLRAAYAALQKEKRVFATQGLEDSADALAVRREEALILMAWGEFQAARPILEEVLARWQQAGGNGPIPSWLLFSRGVLFFELGDLDSARSTLEQAASQSRAEGGAAIPIDYVRAQVLAALGRFDDAERLLAAVEKLKPLPASHSRMTVATLQAQIALGRGAAADAARAIDEELVHLGYPNAKDSVALISALLTGASAHLAAGNAERAQALAAAAVAVTERLARDPAQSARAGIANLLLARVQSSRGDRAAAAATARRAEKALANGLGDDHLLVHKARALADA